MKHCIEALMMLIASRNYHLFDIIIIIENRVHVCLWKLPNFIKRTNIKNEIVDVIVIRNLTSIRLIKEHKQNRSSQFYHEF